MGNSSAAVTDSLTLVNAGSVITFPTVVYAWNAGNVIFVPCQSLSDTSDAGASPQVASCDSQGVLVKIAENAPLFRNIAFTETTARSHAVRRRAFISEYRNPM
jgi:hypothetical protein